ncbi:MAG: hypothetical protein ACLR2G_09600 [Phascolarctobacterium faecium]
MDDEEIFTFGYDAADGFVWLQAAAVTVLKMVIGLDDNFADGLP